jgi:hypothetical protein
MIRGRTPQRVVTAATAGVTTPVGAEETVVAAAVATTKMAIQKYPMMMS